MISYGSPAWKGNKILAIRVSITLVVPLNDEESAQGDAASAHAKRAAAS